MGLKSFIQGLRGGSNEELINWSIDPREGLDFTFSKKLAKAPEEAAYDNPLFGFKYSYLKGLEEQAKARKNADGFTIESAVVPTLEDDFFEVFDLPEPFNGSYRTKITGSTGQSAFSLALQVLLSDGTELSHFSLAGPFLKLAENEYYRLSAAEWQAIKAVEDHQALSSSQRSEYDNNWLIFQLQLAKKAGMAIDLAHFDKLELSSPESIGVAVEEMPNGDLALTPTYGPGLDLQDIKQRLGQIGSNDQQSILRVKDKFVLLDQARLEATQEILTRKRIPKEQVAVFLKSPTAYLNSAMIDLDTGFSLRVHGAERFTQRYFGDIEESGIDWFKAADRLLEPTTELPRSVDSAEGLAEVEKSIENAQTNGATAISYEGKSYDISDQNAVTQAIETIKTRIANPEERPEKPQAEEKPETSQAVVAIDDNDEEVAFAKATVISHSALTTQDFSLSNLKRSPFPHQDEGIRWLLTHFELAQDEPGMGGALLADDMGLGKTYMTLVSIAELYSRLEQQSKLQKPTMVVAPLSLIENWQAEVDVTFETSPFSDIVVLQAGGDLAKYKIKGAARETQQDFDEGAAITQQDQIRYSLKVGNLYGSERLDMPGRLVLTTYQTLRDYQFSLSRINWSVVTFDEAQNLKNPNALATRAAKGLNADFKLLATGTPVENSLKDFWCLMDTAAPGLLGAWQSFRSEYIVPITSASAEEVRGIKTQVGKALRTKVGDYMLRRTKAERLGGLPQKIVFSGQQNSSGDEQFMPVLAAMMRGPQLAFYDEILDSVRNTDQEDRRGIVLPSLLQLKVTSIHHSLAAKQPIPRNTKELINQANNSAKIRSMIDVLKEIEQRGEKVLVFATTKVVQAYVSALVGALFRVPVSIINGDTKAVASKNDANSRKAIIDQFQSEPGFGVIVMSPVAAGVGLTIVGANNVIHLERHWNPAKEAQATDRVYRIGQTRQVNVYLPMALHPELASFDLQLNKLLGNKIDLSDAVVAPAEVQASDMAGVF